VSHGSHFVAKRLRELRAQATLSQEQAAALVGVTFKYYQRLESGAVSGIRLSTIEKVAHAYGIDLTSFFARRSPKTRMPKALPPPHRVRSPRRWVEPGRPS
jgi:transcriptional regulator with XRE-family HTH domain